MSEDVSTRMREDWNARAREDAHYYVAFGRREQNEDEFLATASEVVTGVEWELKRLEEPRNIRARRALEIGCGPGRLMKPLARHFGEIHGVDVSDEMVGLARDRLRAIRHAHVHATNGAELAQFADSSFDLVYSYAVFQHIPDRGVVMEYLNETCRVLKAGGLARLQFNGLPQTAKHYDTWAGVRFAAPELVEFARARDLQIFAMEGAQTQYLWTTWRKRPGGWRAGLSAPAAPPARVRRITNAHSSEPVAPGHGRFASISIWMEDLPAEVDLFDIEVLVAGVQARPTYIGPKDQNGVQQINAILNCGDFTGLATVELRWLGGPLAGPGILRLISPGPLVPKIIAVSDGVNLLSGQKIETGSIKVAVEELPRAEEFAAFLDGREIGGYDVFCTDPLQPRHEINFALPEDVAPGPHTLELRAGRRTFGAYAIDVAPRGTA